MFARVSRVQVKMDKFEESTNLYAGSVVPAAKSQKGFRGAYLLTDRKTGQGLSITLWETEEDAVVNEQSGYYQEQLDKFKDVFAAPPTREGYEVSVQG